MNIEFGVKIRGRCSEFGGPEDEGVTHDEGLALFNSAEEMPQIFLSEQPPKINNERIQEGPGLTTGLARRLNPESFYCAMRWDYSITPKSILRKSIVRVKNEKNGKHLYAICADFGPRSDTNRVIDLSHGALKYLEIETDDVVECLLMPIKEFSEA